MPSPIETLESIVTGHQREDGMNWMTRLSVLTLSVLLPPGLGAASQAQQTNMSFFVTSVGSGKGADLSGLQGADQHCQQLAQAVGAGSRTWRAYLST